MWFQNKVTSEFVKAPLNTSIQQTPPSSRKKN